MLCPYCKNDITNTYFYYRPIRYKCKNHPDLKIRIDCKNNSDDIIEDIFISNSKYEVRLDLKNNITYFLENKGGEDYNLFYVMFQLPYIVNITPDNFNSKIQTILTFLSITHE